MEQTYLSLVFLLDIAKNMGHFIYIFIIHKKNLKDGEKQTSYSPQDSRNDTLMRTLGFLLASNIPDWVLKQQLRNANGLRLKKKKKPKESQLSLAKTMKGSILQDRKLLDKNHSTLAKHHRKNCGPTQNYNSTLARM